jgi:hypothetical protein
MATEKTPNEAPRDYTSDYSKVLDREWTHIKGKRGYEDDRRNNLIGLAISGGGIRSASFATGVIQALVRDKVLGNIDYLSTVSGGGYIGSSLTWFLHDKWKIEEDDKGREFEFGVSPQNFPFGQRLAEGIRFKEKRNAVLDFIRQHTNYLDPGKCINLIALFAVLLRSMALTLLVYFPMIAILFLIFIKTDSFDSSTSASAWVRDLNVLVGVRFNALIWISALIFTVFVLASLLYSLSTFFARRNSTMHYRSRLWFQCWMAVHLSLAIGFAAIGLLPTAVAWFTSQLQAAITAGISTALGVAGGVARHIVELKGKSGTDSLASKLFVWVASILLAYGVLSFAYIVAAQIVTAGSPKLHVVVIVCTLVFVMTFGFWVNTNYISLHRMYRDRLMEVFLPNFDNVWRNMWGPATEADVAPLHEMCGPNATGPYHLINANIILVDSVDSKFRGRGGDSFILSPLYCGSDATGWRSTKTFMKGQMTLPTAMAISGAAINPDTGVAGKGPTRNRLLSSLMSLLNLRLGYWALNCNPTRASLFSRPNHFNPGLKALFGWGYNERAGFVQLSDGGHFENTGLYELIRRRMKVIVLSDGSADPNFTFSDFGNAVERVRVDFGVNIRFPDADVDLQWILPGSAGKGFFPERYNLAKQGFAIGTIQYPDESQTGILIYIKTTLTKDLPADIYGYKSANPTFPDESTSDQFFDETQFEAYRELGYQLTADMLKNPKARNALPSEGNEGR